MRAGVGTPVVVTPTLPAVPETKSAVADEVIVGALDVATVMVKCNVAVLPEMFDAAIVTG